MGPQVLGTVRLSLSSAPCPTLPALLPVLVIWPNSEDLVLFPFFFLLF